MSTKCTLAEASMRLMAIWIERVIEDPDFAIRVTLAEVLSEKNIHTVATLGLFEDYDLKRRLDLLVCGEDKRRIELLARAEEERRDRLIKAWLMPVEKAVRQ